MYVIIVVIVLFLIWYHNRKLQECFLGGGTFRSSGQGWFEQDGLGINGRADDFYQIPKMFHTVNFNTT
jgi:hypothetical protein